MIAKILVVDDDPQVRDVLVRFLEREGYATQTAPDGRQALVMVARDRPDLILLDVTMSDLDGFAVCRRLKEDEHTALIPVTMITGLHDREARTRGIEAGADDVLTKPFEYSMLRARIRTQLRLKRLTDQLERTEQVIFSMARWVEIKDPYTEGHLRRIAGYSEQIALALGLFPEHVTTIRYGGILHDIGKVGVSQGILSKPGPLTLEEQTELRRHAEYGAAIVAPMRFAAEVAPMIWGHHEHWDGHGYPRGLVGDDIPLGARIISVADAWDAMTTDRPYRRALDIEEAVRRLKTGAGTQWDPRLSGVLLELLADGRLLLDALPGVDAETPHIQAC